jgi:hypothetical protein
MKRTFLLLFFVLFSLTKGAFSQNLESWNNPVLIQGSSFGHFFQQLYKQGLYNEMLHFTSQQSIKKYGSAKILKYYQSIDFGYSMKLKSKFNKDNVTTLNYESYILGGKHITKLNVVIENDTCRLLLDNLDFHLGITWEIINAKSIK